MYDFIGISGPDTVGVGVVKAPFFYMVVFDGHVGNVNTPDVGLISRVKSRQEHSGKHAR